MRENIANQDGIVQDQYYEARMANWAPDTWHVFQKLVEQVKEKVGSSAKGLDLGAGEGFFTKCCQENGLDVVALEGAKSAVKWGRQNLGIDSRVHNLKARLPFEGRSQNFVMYHNVYEHVPGDININVFQEAWRVLKPNGIFWIFSTCKYDLVGSQELEHINNPSPSELWRLGKTFGFQPTIRKPGFNISIFTPRIYDRDFNVTPFKKKIRLFVKKHVFSISLIFAPIWVPLWYVNSRFLHLGVLDCFCGGSNVLFHKPTDEELSE